MKLKFIALFIVALVVSCNRQEDLKTKDSTTNATVIGTITPNGVHAITTDQDQLKATIATENKMTKVDLLRVYTNEKNLTILEARGPIAGGKYLTVAHVLTVKNGQTMMMPGCKQSCTSVAPCEGCTLTIDTATSGSCRCSSGFGGSCTHTVECDTSGSI